jgi:hypothetical protein
VLFDCVRSLQEELNPDGDTETEQVMGDHIKLIDDDINASVKGSMHPFIKAMYNLKGRFALYEPVMSRQLDYLNATDKRSAQILTELHDIHKWTFKALIEIIENLEGQLNKVEPTNRSKSAKNLKEGWDQTGDKR